MQFLFNIVRIFILIASLPPLLASLSHYIRCISIISLSSTRGYAPFDFLSLRANRLSAWRDLAQH